MKIFIQQLRKQLIKLLSQYYNCCIIEDEYGRFSLPKSQKAIAADIGISESKLSRLLYPNENDPNTPGIKQYKDTIAKVDSMIAQKRMLKELVSLSPKIFDPQILAEQTLNETTLIPQPRSLFDETMRFYLIFIMPFLLLLYVILNIYYQSNS